MGVALAAIALAVPTASAGGCPRGSDEARAALVPCLASEAVPAPERRAVLQRAVVRAGVSERLLRRAIALAPDSVVARLELARGLAANGDRADAESEATGALVSAVRIADNAHEADARRLVAQLTR